MPFSMCMCDLIFFRLGSFPEQDVAGQLVSFGGLHSEQFSDGVLRLFDEVVGLVGREPGLGVVVGGVPTFLEVTEGASEIAYWSAESRQLGVCQLTVGSAVFQCAVG